MVSSSWNALPWEISVGAVVLRLQGPSRLPVGMVQPQTLGLTPRAAGPVGPGCDLMICNADKQASR